MNFKVILVVISLILHQASAITLYCTRSDDGNDLTLTFRNVVDGTAQQLQAVDTSNQATSECKSSQTTVDTISTNELNITVSLISSTQTSPTIATSDCYVVVTAGTPTVYTVSVVRQATAGVSVLTDSIFTGSCDSDVTASEADIGNSGVTVQSTITPTVITAVTDTISAKLVDNTGADITPPLDIGDEVRLRVTYNPPSGGTDGEVYKGIQMYNVLLSGYSDFRTSFMLITANGCINETASTSLNMNDGPQYSAADSDAAVPSYVFQSGLFETPLLTGPAPKTLYVKFSYRKVCVTLTQQQCADQEQYCIDNALDRNQKRKKRGATEFDVFVSALEMYNPIDVNGDLARMRRSAQEEAENNGTLQFGVPIAVYNNGVLAGKGGKDVTSEEVCEVPDMYWIISVVLGVLLLGTMALCVFLVLRLRKEQNQNDKIAEKLGHRNPGYY